jgi:hypothetical protein
MVKWTPALLMVVGCIYGDNVIPEEDPLVPTDELQAAGCGVIAKLTGNGQTLQLTSEAGFALDSIEVNGVAVTLIDRSEISVDIDNVISVQQRDAVFQPITHDFVLDVQVAGDSSLVGAQVISLCDDGGIATATVELAD